MKKQSEKNQKGEIEFRKFLIQQQVEGGDVLDSEYDANSIETILSERMKKTFKQMSLLKENEVVLSPYIEIGAERCQRSLVMENDLGASGAAIDISYDALKSCDYYSDKFNKTKVPLRICCDANNLPFMSESIPFAFCYETLHHFPDPIPITQEIHRVLMPSGNFFFDEEPYKKILHSDLYKGKKPYSKDSLNPSKIRKFFDFFFSEMNCNEIEYGIIENHKIPIGVWKKALHFFEEKSVKLHSIKNIESELFSSNNQLKFLLAFLLGGSISGKCGKPGVHSKINHTIHDVLICPSCIENGYESKLIRANLSYLCEQCGQKYPVINGVVFLFSEKNFQRLYPEFFKTYLKT